MVKSNEVHMETIDFEKLLIFLNMFTNLINNKKKFRVVIDYNSEKKKTIIEIFS